MNFLKFLAHLCPFWLVEKETWNLLRRIGVCEQYRDLFWPELFLYCLKTAESSSSFFKKICLKLKFSNFCNLDIRNWLSSGTYLPGPESAILFEFEKSWNIFSIFLLYLMIFQSFPSMRKNQNQICKKCREKCPIRHYLAMIQTSNSDWGDKPWYYHLLTKLTAKCHKSLRICRLDMTREGICMYIHTRVSSYPLPCRRRFRKLLGEKLFLLFFGISRNPFCLYSLSSSF